MSFGAIILVAIGGAFALEGMLWAIFPGGARGAYRQVLEQMSERDLHLSGLVSTGIGIAMIVFAVKISS